jgi:DNA-binding Lrp family transcriptional regulator
MRDLTRRGVVRGHHVDVDLKKIGRPVQAMVAVRLRPPDRAVVVMSGSDDFLLHIAVADSDHLSDFVLDRLTQCEEIVDVRTSVIFNHFRRSVVTPLNPG